jgi:GTPase
VEKSRSGRTSQSRYTPPPQPGRAKQRAYVVGAMPEGELDELKELLRTSGVAVVGELIQRRDQPHPNLYLGPGKVQELKALVEQADANLVACDDELTPRQERNLEKELGVPVLDRTAVILDIFAVHARSAEGKLQVELAQLEYSYARQEGLWQHLERLGGGVGTRGPGETQLESDRRLVRNRMATLRRRLRDVARSRDTQRERRAAAPLPRIALAGYTNAGKSSLMNALTDAGVSADDALFETLDPTTRRVEADGHELLLSDTVGFIRNLPHQLVTAFSATLEEVREADLILHVADASEPEPRRGSQADAVAEVLDEIGAAEVPRLAVLNKVDLVGDDDRAALRNRQPDAVQVSAATGEGLDELRRRLADAARVRLTRVELTIPYAQAALISAVYSDGREIEQEATETGTLVRALMPPSSAARLRAALNGG